MTVAKSVLERAAVAATVETVESLGAVCRVSVSDARSALVALRGSDLALDFLVDLFGIDTGEAVDIVYHLRSFARDEELVLKAAHEYGSVLTSVWDLFPAALMPERETAELFGLRLLGHPNPKRLLTTDGCPPYLLKSLEIRTADEVRDRASQNVDGAAHDRPATSIAEPIV